MTGFKTWAAGDILTAADLNGYLRDQSIPIFADITARDAGITAPVEGQFCYVVDQDAFQVYYTNWVNYDLAWKSWTPTWTNVTKGTTPTETYAYIRVGKLVIAHGSLTLGTGGAVTGSITVTLPIASSSAAMSTNAGTVTYNDASAGSFFYGGLSIPVSSSTATLFAYDSSTTYLSRTNTSSTIPFGVAFAVSDKITFNAVYQVA